ncbi:hypothetical protein BGZ60DRAFT_492180 [Tricladium varicosporioides]|nr:hypothetical protein BGZ60DRAFT_492180 [Hymenoscyphus varicosporioides]
MPPAWADKRQQLCDALPCYRTHQAGAYTRDGYCHGLLIDREVGLRDKFDDQIIISTVGGGRSKDDTGKSVRTKDQAESHRAVAFRRSQAEKVPVCVIAGQGNSASPSKFSHYYNVLGWFQVTDVWCEANGLSGTEDEFRKGFVCPSCRMCIRRRDWDGWACENTNCNFVHNLKPRVVPIEKILAEGLTGDSYETIKLLYSPVVSSFDPRPLGNYTIYHFTVPDPNGEKTGDIFLLKSSSLINGQIGGPNDMFKEMQESDLEIKRKAARGKDAITEIVTNHYAANWGAPYKFVVSHESTPFRETPPILLKALKRLTWAGKNAIPLVGQDPFVEFNELLSVGYFEKGEMNYHDDGEKELGPTVASLSLGSSATMSFRPKSKNTIQSPPQRGNAKGEKKPVLSFVIEHGDIVVMKGSGIHGYYEHKVEPHGKVRYALTCRHVLRNMLPNEEERKYFDQAVLLPPGSENYEYDGDIDAKPITPEPTVKEASEEKVRASLADIKAQIQLGRMTKEEILAIINSSI